LPDDDITGLTRHRSLKFRQRVGEPVRRGRQAEFLRRQAPDAFAVHRQVGGARAGNHRREALAFHLQQHVGGDRLDLRHDQLRPLLLDQRAQRGRIGHVQHVRPVRDLVARRVGIAIGGDHLHAQPLQGDDHFFAELARAEQEHARGAR
jgi:hypothetical protein